MGIVPLLSNGTWKWVIGRGIGGNFLLSGWGGRRLEAVGTIPNCWKQSAHRGSMLRGGFLKFSKKVTVMSCTHKLIKILAKVGDEMSLEGGTWGLKILGECGLD